MKLLGAPQALIDSLSQDKVIKIMPMNWPTVIWFTQVQDLLRWRSDGQCLGLDLVQIKTEADLSKRNFTNEEFKKLRMMSISAARAINKVDDE